MRDVVWNGLHFANEVLSLIGWLIQLYAVLDCGGVLDLRRLDESPTRLTQLLLAATCVLLLCALRAARGVRHCLTRAATPAPAGCQSLAIIYLLCCCSAAYLSGCITLPVEMTTTTATATVAPETASQRWLCSSIVRDTMYWWLTIQSIFVVIEQFSDPRLVTCSVSMAGCCRRQPIVVSQADMVPMIERGQRQKHTQMRRSETPISETIEDVSNGSDYVTLDF